MGVESSGEWLEKALTELCKKMETGIGLDGNHIRPRFLLRDGASTRCERIPRSYQHHFINDFYTLKSESCGDYPVFPLATPATALVASNNIIGEEAGKSVTEEYLKRRGHVNVYNTSTRTPTSNLQAYVKPRSDEGPLTTAKKSQRAPKQAMPSSSQENRSKNEKAEPKNTHTTNQGNSKKKKSGKVVTLAEAAKGSIVFQKGKPCSCQARRHRLVSNCLSCGKIVCEQEGEGPCNFCGSLVLKEGSAYAGLDEGVMLVTDAEAAAEEFAKRLVEYDRNSAARTTVIDDQSDYYEIEGNSWLSNEEKELLRKKREELEEAERAKRSKVVMTFDLLGRKVLLNKDEASEEMQNRILLRPPDEREEIRVKTKPKS
ncbi:UNVERIFIED_CONTAM: Activating signal cointegrator 1 [Sesamum radiatum]|uniref:Activating signal cointegrator 1 n=1 Tax=Sesamum radiatum TaxID=300843 RepID=A0AAW2WHV3_SESRA